MVLMKEVLALFTVAEVDFIVPDFNTAERIFVKGMELKCEYKGKLSMVFQLNKDTRLNCWLPKKGTGIWGRWVYLRTSTHRLLKTAERLKNGPDLVYLDTSENSGNKVRQLQIVTPKIYTRLILVDNPFLIPKQGG
jgi:hypothetical protein